MLNVSYTARPLHDPYRILELIVRRFPGTMRAVNINLGIGNYETAVTRTLLFLVDCDRIVI